MGRAVNRSRGVNPIMDELPRLAGLIRRRNSLEYEITAIIGRPAAIGHIGEYIASRIFNISLEKSASFKSIDGRFLDGPLESRSVNIKWYAKLEGVLDITPDALPDYYLVMTGPKSNVTSYDRVRPWTIDYVFLFDAHNLVGELIQRNTKIGIATSIRNVLWKNAEIFPGSTNSAYVLSTKQREALGLFGPAQIDH